MTTQIEDTINLLVKDTQPSLPRHKIIVALILLVPVTFGLVCLAAICTAMPLRAEYFSALSDPYVVAKQAIPALLLLSLLPILRLLSRPEAEPRRILLIPLCIAGIVDVLIIAELITQPASTWSTLIIGKSLPQCFLGIGMIASATLGISLYLLRYGAVTRPVLSGFLAGVLAGSLGAFLYAFLCMEDSPLFYGIWYSLAVVLIVGFGAVLGHKTLRW